MASFFPEGNTASAQDSQNRSLIKLVSLGNAGGGGVGTLSGVGPPAAALGIDGQLYLDTTNGNLYRKWAGAWN